jgi:hypothetical protein
MDYRRSVENHAIAVHFAAVEQDSEFLKTDQGLVDATYIHFHENSAEMAPAESRKAYVEHDRA